MAVRHDVQPTPTMRARPETREGVSAFARRHALRPGDPTIYRSRLLRLLEQVWVKHWLMRGQDMTSLPIREFAQIEPVLEHNADGVFGEGIPTPVAARTVP